LGIIYSDSLQFLLPSEKDRKLHKKDEKQKVYENLKKYPEMVEKLLTSYA